MFQFDFKRIIHNPIGRILLSILLGLGLACLFYRVCKEKDCIIFHGPVIQEVDQKTFEFNDKCYQYEPVPVTCDEKNKKIIDFENEHSRSLTESFLNYMQSQQHLTFDPYSNEGTYTPGASFTMPPKITNAPDASSDKRGM